MSILFQDIVFGPIQSRRLGTSLGINTLPLHSKICNFNCIYCECGWTDLKHVEENFISKEIIFSAIDQRFKEIHDQHEKIDTITFAGNGEPTMHPDFLDIINYTIANRDRYLPGTKIAVLSNAALIGNPDVLEALQKVDLRIMKLDAGTENLFQQIDQPLSKKPLNWYIEKLQQFHGDVYIQTIFLKGEYKGQKIDNTSESELNQWMDAIKKIQPKQVMIYSIDREPPAQQLQKINPEQLQTIADKLINIGIPAKAY